MDDQSVSLPRKRHAEDIDDATPRKEKRETKILSFEELLELCGCRISRPDTSSIEYLVDDPRKFRRNLERHLTLNCAAQSSFLDGIRNHLDPPDSLHAALRPMTVTSKTAVPTGDSLIRALLNTPPLQKDISEYVLHRIPEFSESKQTKSGFGDSTTTAAQLILGQFRWLDCLTDPHALTSTLLEVLPAMPAEAKRDAVAFLPEASPEECHTAVLDALEELVLEDPEFLLPAMEATSSLLLSDDMQKRVINMLMTRLPSADVEDLPPVVRHLLQQTGTSVSATLSMLRQTLHFAVPSDPRLLVSDRKQKGKVPLPGEDPESRILMSIKQSLQFHAAIIDAAMKDIKGLTDPQHHRTFDFWFLLVLCTVSIDRKRSVHSMLKKKFQDGHAVPGWIHRSLTGHGAALLPFFPELLSMAHVLLSDTHAATPAAGIILYTCLFSDFKDACCRQEVLRSLHAHLGSSIQTEVTASLSVLKNLVKGQTHDLLHYAAFLTTMLDYVGSYDDEQLAAVFDIFAELVIGCCSENFDVSSSAVDAGFMISSQAQRTANSSSSRGRSRMEDELFIFLRKQLSGSLPTHRRVGALGVVTLVRRLGKEMESLGVDVNDACHLLAQRYKESRMLLDNTLTSTSTSPDTLCFVCDALAAEAYRNMLSKPFMRDMSAIMGTLLEERFILTRDEWSASRETNGKGCSQSSNSWWSLNGEATDVVVALLPPQGTLSTSSTASISNTLAAPATVFESSKRTASTAPVAAITTHGVVLCALLRATASLHFCMSGSLKPIDALLGVPMGLFPMSRTSPEEYSLLDSTEQCHVVLGLYFALNWCRELTNAFAMLLVDDTGVKRGSSTPSQLLQAMILSRLRSACQLEAALGALLPYAPTSLVLPDLTQRRCAATKKAGIAGKIAGKKGKGRKKQTAPVLPGTGNDLDKDAADQDEDDAMEDNEAADTGTINPPLSPDDDGNGSAERAKEFLGIESRRDAALSPGLTAATINNRNNTATINNSNNTATSMDFLNINWALPPAHRSKFRTLLPSAFSALALGTIQEDRRVSCYAALAPAGYLLTDLLDKLKTSLALPKKVLFFRSNTSKSPAMDVPSAKEMLIALRSIFPSITQHLCLAEKVLQGDLLDDAMQEESAAYLEEMTKDARPEARSSFLALIPECRAAALSASPVPSASMVMSRGLECIRVVFAYHEITSKDHRKTLQVALASFWPVSTPSQQTPANNSGEERSGEFVEERPDPVASLWDSRHLMDATLHCFDFFTKLVPLDQDAAATAAEMQRWPAVLAVLEALLSMGEKLASAADAIATDASVSVQWAKSLALMRQKLSASASCMLHQRWPTGPPSSTLVQEPAAGWKGRAQPLSEAIRLSVQLDRDPMAVVSKYVSENMACVTPVPTGKDNSVPLPELPSMSGITLPVWYKAAWAALLHHWSSVSVAAVSAGKDSMDAEACHAVTGTILEGVRACCVVFSELVEIIQMQEKRSILQSSAVKGACTFLEGVHRVMVFWGREFTEHKEMVISTMKAIQKGTRILHTLCAEAKTRKDIALTARIPKLKRQIERFLVNAVTFLRVQDPELGVQVGELKHRNLGGMVLESSQMYPQEEEEGILDDRKDDGSEEGGGNEEEEGEGSGEEMSIEHDNGKDKKGDEEIVNIFEEEEEEEDSDDEDDDTNEDDEEEIGDDEEYDTDGEQQLERMRKRKMKKKSGSAMRMSMFVDMEAMDDSDEDEDDIGDSEEEGE